MKAGHNIPYGSHLGNLKAAGGFYPQNPEPPQAKAELSSHSWAASIKRVGGIISYRLSEPRQEDQAESSRP